jgi:hypothetical protein
MGGCSAPSQTIQVIQGERIVEIMERSHIPKPQAAALDASELTYIALNVNHTKAACDPNNRSKPVHR